MDGHYVSPRWTAGTAAEVGEQRLDGLRMSRHAAGKEVRHILIQAGELR